MADEVEESFKCLGVKDWLVKQCNAIGIKKPTEIQAKCIPEILKGRDCIACAKTGSGKTAVFALAILQHLCEDPYGVFALVLTPTRNIIAYIIACVYTFWKNTDYEPVLLFVFSDVVTIRNWVIPEKIHTPTTEEIFAVWRERVYN